MPRGESQKQRGTMNVLGFLNSSKSLMYFSCHEWGECDNVLEIISSEVHAPIVRTYIKALYFLPFFWNFNLFIFLFHIWSPQLNWEFGGYSILRILDQVDKFKE